MKGLLVDMPSMLPGGWLLEQSRHCCGCYTVRCIGSLWVKEPLNNISMLIVPSFRACPESSLPVGSYAEVTEGKGRSRGDQRSAEQTKSGPEGVSAANNPGMTRLLEGHLAHSTSGSLAGKLLQQSGDAANRTTCP